MNRIILIGNGFDLAHGMKTSYKHFIDDFWETKGKEVINQEKSHECIFIKINLNINGENKDLKCFDDFLKLGNKKRVKLTFKNSFLSHLSNKNGLENWVDIENEYYLKLKEISKSQDKEALKKLHEEFEQIKNALSDYLKRQEEIFNDNLDENHSNIFSTKEKIKNKITSKFKFRGLNHNTLKKISNELFKSIKTDIKSLENDVVTEYELSDLSREIRRNINANNFTKNDIFRVISNIDNTHDLTGLTSIYPKDVLLLNFNYTNTHLMYDSISKDTLRGFQKVQNIKIHGCIYEPDENPMIFGFGDELDKEYQALEDLDDNDYLENIKSIKYLETANYRRLLEFAESDEFQIFIFGHSCGNSDRTLLNTLFEHDNCISIKPFYYNNSEGKDNYSDIVRNISRNFTSKAKMRSRVVNKTYTNALVS